MARQKYAYFLNPRCVVNFGGGSFVPILMPRITWIAGNECEANKQPNNIHEHYDDNKKFFL